MKKKFNHYKQLIRWDKPVGIFLLLWPTLTALTIASEGQIKALVLLVFISGVFLLRSAGCIINDLLDINFDKYVHRTQNRPLTTGKVTKWEAIILASIMLMIAFGLALLLNRYTIFLAIVGAIFTIIYPLLKRITNLPQLGLGIAFNWGIPMAFAAQTNHIPISGWLLFIIGLLWTISYDTQYAMVDREDDLKIGIKSTAILFGNYDLITLAAIQTIIILLLLMLGLLMHLNLWFYACVIICLGFFIYQNYLIQLRQTPAYFQAFLNNNWAWFIIFFGVYLSYCG